MAALQQPGVEMFLELLDLEGHRRLRHEKPLSGAGEGAVFHHCMKHLESAVCHVYPNKFAL